MQELAVAHAGEGFSRGCRTPNYPVVLVVAGDGRLSLGLAIPRPLPAAGT